MCLTCVQNVHDLFIWVHWGHMTGYILKALNIYPITTLNSHLWVYFKYVQFFTTGHIVIILGWSFKMGAICNQQAHFGHSESKHSECAQFLTIAHIVDPLQRTFKIYPIFNCWVHCGQVLSVPIMYSLCAHWVYGSLFPVPNGEHAWRVLAVQFSTTESVSSSAWEKEHEGGLDGCESVSSAVRGKGDRKSVV